MEHFEDRHKKDNHGSALTVNRGVEQPSAVSPYFRKAARRELSVDDYVNGILGRDITVLSQAITLLESHLPEHYDKAQRIIERCLPHSGRSVRIGITGVPGAGKSTFIEAVGKLRCLAEAANEFANFIEENYNDPR